MLPFIPTLADLGGTLTLLDRTELRVRSPGSAPGQRASMDVETVPEARLAIDTRRMLYTLTFAPRITAWDFASSGFHPVALATGSVRVEWRAAPLVRLWIDQAASYGQVSFASFGAAPGADGTPPRIDVVPTPLVIAFEAERTTLGSRSAFGRWALASSVGYQLSGGANAEARAVLPFQSGPVAEAKAGYAITRVDEEESTISASEASFSSGPEDVLVEVDESWRHRWTRSLDMRLTLGLSEARVRTDAFSPHTLKTDPVAEASLDSQSRFAEGTLDLRAGTRLGPIINQVVGLVDERIQGTLAATHSRQRLVTHVYAGASESIPDTGVNSIRIVSGEVGASYSIVPAVAVDVGARGLWQRQDVSGVTFLQGALFAGLTFRAPPERI